MPFKIKDLGGESTTPSHRDWPHTACVPQVDRLRCSTP